MVFLNDYYNYLSGPPGSRRGGGRDSRGLTHGSAAFLDALPTSSFSSTRAVLPSVPETMSSSSRTPSESQTTTAAAADAKKKTKKKRGGTIPSYMRHTGSSSSSGVGRSRARVPKGSQSSAVKGSVPAKMTAYQQCVLFSKPLFEKSKVFPDISQNFNFRYCYYRRYYRALLPKVKKRHPLWVQPRVAKRIGQLYRSARRMGQLQFDADGNLLGFDDDDDDDDAGGDGAGAGGRRGGGKRGGGLGTGGANSKAQSLSAKKGWSKVKQVVPEKKAGMGDVVLDIIAQIEKGGTSDEWIEKQWRSIAVHNGKHISMSELYRWLDVSLPVLPPVKIIYYLINLSLSLSPPLRSHPHLLLSPSLSLPSFFPVHLFLSPSPLPRLYAHL